MISSQLMSILSRTSYISIILGLTLSLASCSNPRDASKENFEKLIKTSIKNLPSCDLSSHFLPINVFEKDLLSDADKNKVKQLDFLVSIGFLEVNIKNVSKPSFTIFSSPSPEPAKVYEITAEGKKNSRQRVRRISDAEKMMGGADSSSSYSFCYAKSRELISVEAFGDPVEQEGMKVVKVPFKYKITEMADWVAKSPDKEFFARRSNSQHFDTLTLKLTNEGWKIVSLSSYE